jgi:hypothetical protein
VIFEAPGHQHLGRSALPHRIYPDFDMETLISRARAFLGADALRFLGFAHGPAISRSGDRSRTVAIFQI